MSSESTKTINCKIDLGAGGGISAYHSVVLFIVNGTPTHYEDNEGTKRYSEPHIIVLHHICYSRKMCA